MELEEELEQAKILIRAHRQFHSILKNMAQQQSDVEIINQLINAIEHLFPDRIGSVLIVNPAKNVLCQSQSHSKLPDFYQEVADGTPIGPTYGSCGAAAHNKEPYIVSDTYNHPNWQPYLDSIKKAQLKSCWSMPIMSKGNQVLGTFAIYSHEIAEPTKYELEVLENAAFVASVALDKEQLIKAACTDQLTGLNNRGHFEQSFDHLISIAERNKQSLGLVFMDLNKFKQINDQLGHSEGDKVLVATANALTGCLRKTDISCRYGGDEFMFASININKSEIDHLCQRIRMRLLNETCNDAKELNFGISFGGILFPPNVAYSTGDLIKFADQEMYIAKNTDNGISVTPLY